MQRFYQGRFSPKNISKYKGDVSNIWYRSSWECKVFSWLDNDPSVRQWSSEEIVIPYISPKDNRIHRYFPDVFAIMETRQGIKSFLVEIKPYNQTLPPKQPKRKTKSFWNSLFEWTINQAKWDAAKQYCDMKGFEFKIITEKDIFK